MGEETCNLIVCPWEDKVSFPTEVLCLDVMCIQWKLHTIRLHWSNVSKVIRTQLWMVHVTNKVTIATPVEISCKIDSVVKESKVETKVELTFLLVGKVLITELLIVTSLLNRSKWTPRHCCCEDWQWVSYRRTVTSKWVTQAECSMCQRLLKYLIKPTFLMCVPCTRNVIGWQPTSWCSLT